MFHHFAVEGGLVAAERAFPLGQLRICDKEIGCNRKGFNLSSIICRLYESPESDDFRSAVLINRAEHKQKENNAM
jgi:hypothetical protein